MKFDYFEYVDAIDVADLTAAEKAVAKVYGKSFNPERTDGKPEESTMGIFRLVCMTGFKKTAVKDARKSLLEKGWLFTQRRMGSSSLTGCAIPAGFDYNEAKAIQDIEVESLNKGNNAKLNKIEKVVESPVSPSKETVVPVEPIVILAPENPTVGQDEAILEPVKAVVEEPEPAENDCELTGHVLTIVKQSVNPELAEVYYRDVEFSPGNDEIKRAAMAKTEADWDERRFIPGFDDYGNETLIEYILRMKKKETVNA